MSRILITPRSLSRGGHDGLKPLEEAGFELVTPTPGMTPSENDLMAALPGCVGWIAGVEPVSEKVIGASTDLRVISRNGTGVDNLPLSFLKARNIEVCRATATNARGVAELALTLALSGLRRVVPTHCGMKAGAWPREIGKEMQGAIVGVVGLGAIGADFARLCLSLGAKVKGFDPYAKVDLISHPGFELTDLEGVFQGADVVSLHAPAPEDGTPLVTRQHLDAMVFSSVLVNTARAGLIDEDVLLSALQSGQIASYATDVFEVEPPQPTELLAHPNVLLTSHIGGFTKESVDRSTQRAVENLLKALEKHEA